MQDGTLRSTFLCLATAAAALCGLTQELGVAEDVQPAMIVTAANPSPQTLPGLGVWQEGKLTLVSASFPNVRDFTCDSWCYEAEVNFIGARPLEGGKIEVRHRDRNRPEAVVVTDVIPEPGAVEFIARMELDSEGHPGAAMPDRPTWLNLCWQLRRAPLFASKPDPYPEFVKRCFIFTDKGLTSLMETARSKIPVRPADHEYNTPPWVQSYVGVWQEIPEVSPESWAGFSTDRYITTVVGCLSRDGKYLTAIANDSASSMCQAWHDCMHNNPEWLPVDAPAADRRWRLKIYAMANDPKALLERVAKDFPNAKHVKPFQRVPAKK